MSMVAAFTHLGLKSKPNPQAVTPDYGLQVFGFSRVQPLETYRPEAYIRTPSPQKQRPRQPAKQEGCLGTAVGFVGVVA